MCNRYPVSQRDSVVRIGSQSAVSRQCLSPALAQLVTEGKVRYIIDIDIKGKPAWGDPLIARLDVPYEYYQVDDNSILPEPFAEELTVLGQRLVAYVACPTAHRLMYVEQLRYAGCRTAVEKPLSRDVEAVRSLVEQDRDNLYPIGYQLFKARIERFLNIAKSTNVVKAEGIEFCFMERDDLGGRAIDDVIWDKGWQGFEVMMAMFHAGGVPAEFVICEVEAATYQPRPGQRYPQDFTAARIDGYVDIGRDCIPFVIRVGKGLDFDLKELAVWGRRGRVSRLVSLGENGWNAHYRVLNELICSETPDMKLSIDEVAKLVRACAEAESLVTDQGIYSFGCTPGFLRGGRAVA